MSKNREMLLTIKFGDPWPAMMKHHWLYNDDMLFTELEKALVLEMLTTGTITKINLTEAERVAAAEKKETIQLLKDAEQYKKATEEAIGSGDEKDFTNFQHEVALDWYTRAAGIKK